MASITSPSTTSFSLISQSVADLSETDAISRSSTSLNSLSNKFDIDSAALNTHSHDLPWILYRILDCQLSCELPLRIMFAYNSGQKLPSLRQAHRWWQYGKQGKLVIQFLSSRDKITPSLDDTTLENLQKPPFGPPEAFNPDHHPHDRFMDQGNEALLDADFLEIGRERRQSEGLPPSFIQRFCLEEAFPANYDSANFDQALTGLDYIRDLEVTRQASLREAARRLCITKENWRDVLTVDPDAKLWVENMQALEFDIETYYANIFLDLRIWTMISELQCPKFYKPNVLAMLNTLFPPCVKELPNDKIDKTVLHKHRAHLYRYILEVEKKGPKVLKHLVEDLLKPGTKHSWPETRHNLEQYLERAEYMITASTAIHDIRFFQDTATNYAVRTPSLSERPTTGESGNTTVSSHQSHTSYGSTYSPTLNAPRSPLQTLDSSKSRHRVHSRAKISTPADQQFYFEPIESPWTSQQKVPNFGNLEQSFSGASRTASPSVTQYADSTSSFVGVNGMKASGTTTPQVDTSSIKSRLRAESRPESPLLVQGSEAAQHESFTRPITPFADKRQEVIARRETISGRSSSFEVSQTASSTPKMSSLEFSRTSSTTPEMGSYYNPCPGTRRRKASLLAKPPLINDSFEFLKRPYEPEPPTCALPRNPSQYALKKVSSISSFFVRKKSSVASIATVRDNGIVDSENALGIPMEPRALRPTKSTETFSRFSEDTPSARKTCKKQKSYGAIERLKGFPAMHSFRSGIAVDIAHTEPTGYTEKFPTFSQKTQSRLRTLKKQVSYSALERSSTRPTMHSFRSCDATATPDVAELVVSGIAEDTEQLKRMLKPKSSLPNLSCKRFYEKAEDGSGGIDHFFVQTGDDYERYRHIPVPRPPPTQVLKKNDPKKEVRKAKSFSSLRSRAANEMEKATRPRKSSLFRREPQEGDKIRGKTISEPFPMIFHDSPALLAPESRSKEYTRKWFLEQGRARRYDLNPPAGDPIKDELHEEKDDMKLPSLVKKVLGKEEIDDKEFEFPRATPKPLVRPERQRWDSIFPRRAPPRPKKELVRNYTPIDLGRYAKFPGKQMF